MCRFVLAIALYIYFPLFFQFSHSLDTSHSGYISMHVVNLFANGKKNDHKNISCFHIYTFKCISKNYVERTNLKYRWGDCIIVANLEIFDTRHDIWKLQRTNFTQTRFSSSTEASYIRGGLVSSLQVINSYLESVVFPEHPLGS